MSIISQQLKPFASLLGHEAMPKKDFMKMAHRVALNSQLHLVNLLQMMQFCNVRKDGNEIIFE